MNLGHLAIKQMVRAGDEVVEAVLFGGEPSGVVPLLAELAVAADVGHHVDADLLQPQQQLGIEPQHQRDAVTAVRGQQRRRGSVPWGAGCVWVPNTVSPHATWEYS
jgi:hypothetical protein